ncbi:MAG: hypothetical protein IKJ70_01300, partial [Clostridia bacterium]|nr:hypothetical protein [Clostridia bacterium]
MQSAKTLTLKGTADSPAPHKAVFVSRTKFPVSLPKASQGDSLAAFLALIQEIFSSYETAK